MKKRHILTDEEKLLVGQRATSICSNIIRKGNTFFSYGDYHFWWDGPRLKDPQLAPAGSDLADFDDTEDVRLALYDHHYLNIDERELWNAIAEEVRYIAHGCCEEMVHHPAVDLDVFKTRGKRMKRITVRNYFWDRLHYNKTRGI
jgi:hypothetical protein